MTAPRIVEVKRRLDGSEARFECELLSRTNALVVAVFRFEDPRRGPIDSYGLFWRRRPYLCYHMVPQASSADIRSRFDVIRDMRFGSEELLYTDLLLDLWVEDGIPRWEDDDEVEALERVGRLDPSDRVRIERGREVLMRGYPRIIAEVRQTLRSLARRA